MSNPADLAEHMAWNDDLDNIFSWNGLHPARTESKVDGVFAPDSSQADRPPTSIICSMRSII